MTHSLPDDLWREFPKTAPAFEARFATEEDCRAYWIMARWGGKPACARCESTRVWTIRCGTTFECADCGHQTSLTSGTVLEKTRKPLKMWFRAIFEISTSSRSATTGARLWASHASPPASSRALSPSRRSQCEKSSMPHGLIDASLQFTRRQPELKG